MYGVYGVSVCLSASICLIIISLLARTLEPSDSLQSSDPLASNRTRSMIRGD